MMHYLDELRGLLFMQNMSSAVFQFSTAPQLILLKSKDDFNFSVNSEVLLEHSINGSTKTNCEALIPHLKIQVQLILNSSD